MKQDNLFADSPRASSIASSPIVPDSVTRIRRSAAWAAYGDAIGFISELTDVDGLKRRTQGRPLETTMDWKRRIGGRNGVQVDLPAGCYSDDTQLRLATSRSIVCGGFDVETFAKVELPVFPAYALGAGLGTKAAAANLARSSTPWFSNTYKGWLDGGGNGAAMRIQPHVWSAYARNDTAGMMRDVLRNSVCTHAHPIAILGSYLHAASVDFALRTQTAPGVADISRFISDARHLPSLMDDDRDGLRNWKSGWQAASNREFADGLGEAINEIQRCLQTVSDLDPDAADYYSTVIGLLGLLNPDRRGSGAHTALAAALLASSSRSPDQAIVSAAGELGSDTDTIATMAGAIIGCCTDVDPSGEVQDSQYIEAEVDRIADNVDGHPSDQHSYPDLLSWSPPRTQADALLLDGDRPHVAGLGAVARLSNDAMWSQDKKYAWQWAELSFGQTVLIKRRQDLHQLASGNRIPAVSGARSKASNEKHQTPIAEPPQEVRFSPLADPTASSGEESHPINLTDVLAWLEQRSYDDRSIGYALRRTAVRGRPEQVASLLAVVLERVKHDA